MLAGLIMYLGNQHDLYIPHMKPAIELLHWLRREEDNLETYWEELDRLNFSHDHIFIASFKAIDICSICLATFGQTLGGRIRRGCIECQGESPAFLTTIWEYRLASDLNISYQYLETHLAEALLIHKKVKEYAKIQHCKTETRSEHKSEPATEQRNSTRRFSI